MYLKLFIIGVMLFLISCQKSKQDFYRPSSQAASVIASREDAFVKVKHYLAKHFPSEGLQAITDVSFIQTKQRVIALIFYRTNTGEHNLVIEKQTGEEQNTTAEKISTCYGDDCTCKVKVVVDSKGNVDVGCNCSSCYMVTTEV